MPESVKDRCTKSYEHIFLLSKNRTYFFDHEAIKEPRQIKGRAMIETQEYRARRDVWDISTRGTNVAHFATFPEELAKICILAGSRENGIVLDPFIGSGTTAISALKENRKYIGIELNEKYAEFAEKRIADANRRLLNE